MLQRAQEVRPGQPEASNQSEAHCVPGGLGQIQHPLLMPPRAGSPRPGKRAVLAGPEERQAAGGRGAGGKEVFTLCLFMIFEIGTR